MKNDKFEEIKELSNNIKNNSEKLCDMEDIVLNYIKLVEESIINNHQKVVIEVNRGIADVTSCPKNIEVEIIDYDNEDMEIVYVSKDGSEFTKVDVYKEITEWLNHESNILPNTKYVHDKLYTYIVHQVLTEESPNYILNQIDNDKIEAIFDIRKVKKTTIFIANNKNKIKENFYGI